MPTVEPAVRVYTIGHSNHSPETFGSLLAVHGITLLADTRSSPYSKFATQFNREVLARRLVAGGTNYLYIGDALGGKPTDPAFYDEAGMPDYRQIASTPGFRQGIGRLLSLARSEKLAVMCGEEDPRDCHRRLLVGAALSERGAEMLHIRGDGSVEPERPVSLERRVADRGAQLSFLESQSAPK